MNKPLRPLTLCLAFFGLLLATPLAAEEPADSIIGGALYDIERAEQQVGAMTPSQGAAARRLTKLLSLTEERLQSSPNQGHSSWTEAAERLAKVKADLAELTAGRMPGQDTAPAAAAPAAAAPATSAPAAEVEAGASVRLSADPALAAIQQELAALEGEIAATEASQRDAIVAQRDRLNALAGKLKAYPDQSQPDWAVAAQGYNELNDKMNKLIAAANAAPSGSQQAAPAGSASGGAASAAVDPNVERAQREMGMIARQAEDMQPGDRRLAERFLRDLGRIDETLAAVPEQSQPSWQEAKAQHDALRENVVSKVATGLMSDLKRLTDRLNGMQPLQYAIEADVAEMRGGFDALRGTAAALASPQNPELASVMANTDRISGEFEARVQAAAAEQGALGDVPAQLAAAVQRNQDLAVPDYLENPASQADIEAYVQAVAAIQRQIQEDGAWLQSVNGKAPLTVEQGNDFRRLLSVLTREKPQEMQQSIQVSQANLNVPTEFAMRDVAFVAETDPRDWNHQANRLLGKGVYAEHQARLEKDLQAVRVAAAFETALGLEAPADRQSQIAQIEQARAQLAEKRQTALQSVRMPESKSDDSELLEAADEVLSRPESKHPYKRMVVNLEKRQHEKTTTDISLDSVSAAGTVSGTATSYHYLWDEFQVTTAEQEGDAWFLYANRLRFFHKGGPTTPTGRWILADRFQSMEIPEANIELD